MPEVTCMKLLGLSSQARQICCRHSTLQLVAVTEAMSVTSESGSDVLTQEDDSCFPGNSLLFYLSQDAQTYFESLDTDVQV